MITKICLRFFSFLIYFQCTPFFINMQKSAISQMIREELIRALVFGVGFLTILSFGFVGIASAASGGIFGDVLNAILASGNWQTDTTGKVKNTEKLGGDTADKFVRVNPLQSCAVGKCITGFNPDGSVNCTP